VATRRFVGVLSVVGLLASLANCSSTSASGVSSATLAGKTFRPASPVILWWPDQRWLSPSRRRSFRP